MALHLSNRRGRISASNFLRPNMTPMSLSDGGSIVVGPVTGLQGAPGFTGMGGFASGADMPIASPVAPLQQARATQMGDPGFEDQTVAQGVQQNAATPAQFYAGMGLGDSAMQQAQAGYQGVAMASQAVRGNLRELGSMYTASTAGMAPIGMSAQEARARMGEGPEAARQMSAREFQQKIGQGPEAAKGISAREFQDYLENDWDGKPR
jgi:hypothetical protein